MNYEKTIQKNNSEDAFSTPHIQDEYPFWISEYGHTYSVSNYHKISQNSARTRIEYIYSGKGVINSKNMSCIVSAGDTYILHEGDDHNYYSHPSAPMDKIWINIKGVLAQEIIKIYHLNDTILFKGIDSSEWIKKIHKICESNQDSSVIQSQVSACFLNFIQFLSKEYTEQQREIDYLDDVRTYIDLHVQDRITIERLSEISNKSPDHTIRLFKNKFGITPHQYILKSKIELAKSLLNVHSESIEEISELLGFCDSAYFSNAFLKNCGMRPGEFRKMCADTSESIAEQKNMTKFKNE